MKRFLFSLERVLALYRLRREEKERALKACFEQKTGLLREQERIQKEYRSFLACMPLDVGTARELRERIRRHDYLDALKKVEQFLEKELMLIEEILEKRKAALLAARRDEKALEKLKEKRFRKWKEEADLEERKFLDEIGTRRFMDERLLSAEEVPSFPYSYGDK